MSEYKFYCKVCADGRLYNGCMALARYLPDPLPPNALALDDVPDNILDGHNYLWDGENLTYSPAEKPPEETESEAVP